MKTFKLLDYTAQVFYNKEQHYPFCLHLYDNCSGKQLHVGYYISVLHDNVVKAVKSLR